MKSRLALIGACVVVVAVVGVVVLAQSSPPSVVPVGEGLALGPAIRHTRAATDPLAQLATGAVDAAAGGAVVDVDDSPPLASERELLDLTNQERARNGLQPVTFDPAMLRVARLRAAAQVPEGKLSHYNGLGELAFIGLLVDAGVDYALAGENLAMASTVRADTVARLHEALMNSPTHRANILEPSYDRLAVGATSGQNQPLALAEIFRAIGHTDG